MTLQGGALGVIADTHGLLRPEAVHALEGCDQIIHAGDIGSMPVLKALERLAPTVAVRGNVDRGEWARALPTDAMLSVVGVTIYILHDLQELDLDPVTVGVRVVISGHSHQARNVEKDGVIYLNPGAAGPRRFRLPVTLARLEIRPDGEVQTRLIPLLDP